MHHTGSICEKPTLKLHRHRTSVPGWRRVGGCAGRVSDRIRDARVLAGGQAGRVGAGDGRRRGVRAGETGRVLLRLQPERRDAGAHGRAGFGRGAMMIHVRIGGRGVGARRRRHAGRPGRAGQAGAHASRQHRAGAGHPGRHRRCRRVEAVDRVLVVVGRHDRRAERVHRPRERLGTERGRHLRPVVVRVGRVQRVGVGERLHELRAEPVLEVGRRDRVHLVPLPLAPLGPPVFEPYLRGWKSGKKAAL